MSGEVVLAFPHGHEGSMRFCKSLVFALAYDMSPQGPRHIAGFMPNSSGANITNARNEIVTKFLAESDTEWLWFVDTDMTFDADVVDRMLASAHKDERPILGALCFSLQGGNRAAPTIYVLRDDGKVGRVFDYPRAQLIQAFATGTGCLLVHRSVFEKMRESGKFPPAYPWFREDALGDLPCGEDITFCIRAASLGIPTHVDTSIKVGHEKPFIVDEAMFEAQQAAGLPEIPTYVVVAVKDTATPVPTFAGAAGVAVLPNTDEPLNLSAKWNAGLDMAEKAARDAGHSEWNVLIANDDIEVAPDFLKRLGDGLRSHEHIWITYPDTTGKVPPGQVAGATNKDYAGQTLTGWAFMVRGESGLRFDEQFRFWYGDSDIEKQVRAAHKHVVAVGGCDIRHLRPMQSTRGEMLEVAKEDERRFAKKWHLSVNDLWLAKHPEFGA